MRTLKELYQLVLNEFDNIPFYGICSKISGLELSNEEWILLHKDFENRKINWWSKFYWNKSFKGQWGYWWTTNKKGNEQRKLYLQYIINSL